MQDNLKNIWRAEQIRLAERKSWFDPSMSAAMPASLVRDYELGDLTGIGMHIPKNRVQNFDP